MSLPQPLFAEDQRERDGCMMPPLTWWQLLVRQVFPRRGVRDCCHYHRQDVHAIAAAVLAVHRQVDRENFVDDVADELVLRLLGHFELKEAERQTAWLLLLENCGIEVWRPQGERRWTYQEGRHRARALMDAGVRRIVVTSTDERYLD